MVEKVPVWIDGQRVYLRVTRLYCRHCRAFERKVVVNTKVIPDGKMDLLPDGKEVGICLGCYEFGQYFGRSEPLFQAFTLMPVAARVCEMELATVAT